MTQLETYFTLEDPKIDRDALNEALYSISENYLWPDSIDSMSEEQAIFVWKIVEKVKKNGFPENLKM